MAINHNAVVTAKNFLEAARASQLDLRDEYGLPKAGQDQARIAGLHQQINFAFKTAEISALVGIAEELEKFNRRASQGPNLTERLDAAAGRIETATPSVASIRPSE